jgi:hypothetical protein
MSSSDIRTIRTDSDGDLGVGPARIRQIQVLTNATGNGRLTIKDGGASGATVLDIDFLTSDSHSINIPDYGIRCASGVYISALTNIDAMTVFYS